MPRLALFTLAALACWGLLPIALDPDAFWHLRLGRDLLGGSGAIVGPESLSPLSAATVVDHSWLYGVLLALGEGALGLIGMSLVALLPYLVIVVAMEAWLRLRLPDWRWFDRALAIAALLVAARPVSLPRAGTYDVAFALLLLLIFAVPSRRRLLVLPLLAGAWTTLHGAGLLLGALIAAISLLELVRRRSSLRAPLVALGAAVGVVVTLPGGVASALYPFAVVASEAQRTWIAEWQSPFLLADPALLPAALLVGTLLVGLLRGGWRAIGPLELLLALPLLAAAALSTRWLLLALLVGALLLLPAARLGLRRRVRPPMDETAARTVGAAVAAIALLIASTRLLSVVFGGNEAALAARYPVAGARVVAAHAACPVLAPYDWGGYLSAHGAPAVALYGEAGALEAGGVDLGAWFAAEAGLRPSLPLLDDAGLDLVMAADGAPIDRELQAAGWRALDRQVGVSVLYARPGIDCTR
jgi:hypothetical protein